MGGWWGRRPQAEVGQAGALAVAAAAAVARPSRQTGARRTYQPVACPPQRQGRLRGGQAGVWGLSGAKATRQVATGARCWTLGSQQTGAHKGATIGLPAVPLPTQVPLAALSAERAHSHHQLYRLIRSSYQFSCRQAMQHVQGMHSMQWAGCSCRLAGRGLEERQARGVAGGGGQVVCRLALLCSAQAGVSSIAAQHAAGARAAHHRGMDQG